MRGSIIYPMSLLEEQTVKLSFRSAFDANNCHTFYFGETGDLSPSDVPG
jgi:hypothetical protein